MRISGSILRLIAYYPEGVIAEMADGFEMPASRTYNTKSLLGTSERSTLGLSFTIALVLLGVVKT